MDVCLVHIFTKIIITSLYLTEVSFQKKNIPSCKVLFDDQENMVGSQAFYVTSFFKEENQGQTTRKEVGFIFIWIDYWK